MNGEEIYDALTDIRDDFITEARVTKLKKSRISVMRWCAVAASVILVLGIGSYILLNGNSPIAPGGTSGGAGHPDGSTVFMSYAGPVFPLSVLDNTVSNTASRDITFNYNGFGETKTAANGLLLHQSDIQVSDSYILTNDTASDNTVKLLYPFAGSFSELQRVLPVLSAGDTILQTELMAGPYSGGFAGVGDDNMTLNLKTISSWEDYTALLSNGEYLKHTLKNAPELNQTVTVYEFANAWADHDKAVNPTLAASFQLDYERTTVLTYGFHGASVDIENGFMRQSFSVPQEGYPRYGRNFYLIVVGDDISDFGIQGYENGGCNDGEEMEDVTADITCYEAVLGEVLTLLLDDFMAQYYKDRAGEPGYLNSSLDMAMLYRAAAELLCDYGVLSNHGADRYDMGWLDDIFSEMLVMDRVFYLTADINIPAGEKVALKADMIKMGSFDFHGSGSENMGIYGYDMVTRLGSNLIFNEVTAELLGADRIEIVRQNFGFDLASGILNVALDPDTEHYYMEVRGAASEN